MFGGPANAAAAVANKIDIATSARMACPFIRKVIGSTAAQRATDYGRYELERPLELYAQGGCQTIAERSKVSDLAAGSVTPERRFACCEDLASPRARLGSDHARESAASGQFALDFSRSRNIATSAPIAVCNAGSTSGANNGE